MRRKIVMRFKKIVEAAKEKFREVYSLDDFASMEDGMGTVEVILIIVVLIGLVLIFKKQIRAVVENVMNKITADSESVMS